MAQSFREAGHLPQRRPDGQPAPPEGLPRQRRGTTPQRHGRYPDYDVLEHAGHWDEVTRRTVLARVDDVPPVRFFDAAQAATLRAFCDTVTAQDAEPRIPVLEMVDAKLHAGRLDGFRYADMPPDDETWRRVARGLDEAAGGSFAALAEDARRAVVGRFAAGELTRGTWEELPCARAWSVVMRAVLSAFYSHPWAWNEIGYGGPRYPRGYVRLHADGHAHDEGVEAFDVDPVPDVARREG
jgi:gluconate 2-dehydrogenase subunit 3-like protein